MCKCAMRVQLLYLFLAHVNVRSFVEMRSHIWANQEGDLLMQHWHSESLAMLLIPLINESEWTL